MKIYFKLQQFGYDEESFYGKIMEDSIDKGIDYEQKINLLTLLNKLADIYQIYFTPEE